MPVEHNQEHAVLKKLAFSMIETGAGYGFLQETIFPEATKKASLNNAQDIKDLLNHALRYKQHELVTQLLPLTRSNRYNDGNRFLLSKELFYIYAVDMELTDKQCHNLDKIFEQLSLMKQKIEDLESRQQTKEVGVANKLLYNLQNELLVLAKNNNLDALETCYANCTRHITAIQDSALVQQSGWKEFLNGLAKFFTFGKYHPRNEAKEIMFDGTSRVLDNWHSTFSGPESKKTEHEAQFRTNKQNALKAIKEGSLDSFLRYKNATYTVIANEEKDNKSTQEGSSEDNHEDIQDYLNYALAYQKSEIVNHLLKTALEPDFPNKLKLKPLVISKELFYIYATGIGKLSDQQIHSFDKIFDKLNIIHHKIIELTLQDLNSEYLRPDSSVFQAVTLLHQLQDEMIQVANGKDINEFNKACDNLLTNTDIAETWGNVFHRLKLSILGHSTIGANRYALHTPKAIIRDTQEAIRSLQPEFNRLQ